MKSKKFIILKLVFIIIVLVILAFMCEKVSTKIYITLITKDYWNSLCTSIWSSQLVFSFFAATLFTFILDKNKIDYYGISYYKAVSEIYTKFKLSLTELLIISLSLGASNLIFVVASMLNAVIFTFIINVLVIIIALTITLDCILSVEKLKKSLKAYIFENLIENPSYKHYFQDFVLAAVNSYFNDRIKFDEDIYFISNTLLNYEKFKNNENVINEIVKSIYEISNRLGKYNIADISLIKKLANMHYEIIKAYKENISDEIEFEFTIKYLNVFCYLSKQFEDEDIYNLLEDWDIGNIEITTFETRVNNELDKYVTLLLNNNKTKSAKLLLEKYEKVIHRLKGHEDNLFPAFLFFDSLILIGKKQNIDFKFFYFLQSFLEYIENKNSNQENNYYDIKRNVMVDFGIKLSRLYLAIENNTTIDYQEKNRVLLEIEKFIIKRYCEDKEKHSSWEAAIMFSVKSFYEQGKERLLSLLDVLCNFQVFMSNEVARKNLLIGRLSYYFFYIISSDDVFSTNQIEYVKFNISHSLHKSHYHFLNVLKNSGINIWECYIENNYDNVFLIDMEYSIDKVEYKGYTPFLTNNWINYFILFSSYFCNQYQLLMNKKIFDWASLDDGDFLRIMECFYRDGHLTDSTKKYNEKFIEMFSTDEKVWLSCKNEILYKQLQLAYKERMLLEQKKNHDTACIKEKINSIINKLKKVILAHRTNISVDKEQSFYVVESSGVIAGTIHHIGDSFESKIVKKIIAEKYDFTDVEIIIEQIKLEDIPFCRIDQETSDSWYVNVKNEIFIKMNHEELQEYISNRFIKFVVFLK